MTPRLASFRARIFLVSLAVVTAILGLVGIITWKSAMAYTTEQLDIRLCEETRRLVTFTPPSSLDRFQHDAASKLHLQAAEQVVASLRTPAGALIKSERWPADLNPDSWAWVERVDRAPAGRPDDHRPGPGAAASGPLQGMQAPPRPEGSPARFDEPGPPHGVAGEPAPRLPAGPRAACQVASFEARGSDWRAARVASDGGQGNAVVAADLQGLRNTLRSALGSVVWRAAPLAMLLTALGAWLMSALAMRPVARLQATMDAVDQQSLEHRLPSEDEDAEFQALIGAYNRMLDRLEASFLQAMRFSADAAHELRTPLTILQGQIEQAMRQSADLASQVRLSRMLDEVIRLSTITRKLLLLSQADGGRMALLRTPFELEPMLQERLEDARSSLPGVTISGEFLGHSLVSADRPLMEQLINNLCGNACSYTPEGGWILVRLRQQDAGLEVVWSNSCLPLSSTERSRVFDRFFRGDPAHSRHIDGHGLGLSISREIARAHGGDLTLVASSPSEFTLRLWLPRT